MDRELRFQIDLEAPIEEVWTAWTTEAGARAWFAPECRIDLRPGGAYEMYWEMQRPQGQQGSDEMIVLSAQAPHLLSFTWNAPMDMGELRQQRTHVTVRLEALDDQRTRLHFCEDAGAPARSGTPAMSISARPGAAPCCRCWPAILSRVRWTGKTAPTSVTTAL